MNKWALITGASSGIGASMSKVLAEEGYNLILVDKVDFKKQEVYPFISKAYPHLIMHSILIDLTKEDAAKIIYQDVKNKNIKLDILINNAGFGILGLFSEIDWEKEKRMIRLHIETLTYLTKLFLSDMLIAGEGKILNVASVAAFQPSPLMAVYNATKAYILSFSAALANEVKGSGVSVTVLCPGLTRTGFQKSVGVGDPDFTKNSWFSDDPDQIARIGIRAMHLGKSEVIPGILNKTLVIIQRFLPRSLVTRLMRKIQENNRKFLATRSKKRK